LGATAISASVAAPSIEAELLHQVAFRPPEREFLLRRDRYRGRAEKALFGIVTRSSAVRPLTRKIAPTAAGE